MARTRTLLELRDEVRDRSDTESVTVVTDAQIDRYINESITDLYDLLIDAQGQEFFLKMLATNAVSGTNTYTLPTDFYILRGVDIDLGDINPTPIRPYMFDERHRGGNNGWGPFASVRYRTYSVAGTSGATYSIRFTPTPTGTNEITIWYIPHAPELTDDAHVWDGFNGWEEYVVVDSAMKCLEKQDLDTSTLQVRLARLANRIQSLAHARDFGMPERVVDIHEDNRYQWEIL